MDDYLNLKEALIGVDHETVSLIEKAEALLGDSTQAFAQWRESCDAISSQLMEYVVRIGVVGAIKSGKSTFINSLLADDYLKRGAGVVTSIVTRIRKGDQRLAKLFFKSWDEINTEIEQALVLFPSDHWKPEHAHFDIRRQKDRQELDRALDSLDSGLRVNQDQLNANGVLLSSYLKGFDQVHDLVGPDNVTVALDEKRLRTHREFVSSDALAVYLKDIELQVTGHAIGANIEIADCQGSDSANPLHMAMIQDYLLKTHLIIYVISSRTGVRQADIRFLSMIKQMGIADNIIFVCNCDLSEHDNLDDLERLIGRITEELRLIITDPRLYSLSALFHLFAACEDHLAEKDRQRLAIWRQAEALVAFSSEGNRRLQAELNRKLTRERSALLLKNQLERLDVNLGGFKQWIRLNREMRGRDAIEADKLAVSIAKHQGHIQQVENMIQSTMSGAVQKKKAELKRRIDSFFDRQNGTVLSKTVNFVRNYQADTDRFQEMLTTSGFSQTMYVVYQHFKQSLDAFMAEQINPAIIRFIGQEEKKLIDFLRTVADPYEGMVKTALVQYETSLDHFDISAMAAQWNFDFTPDLESIKQSIGLSLQPATTGMRYSAQIKTEAMARFGFYSLLKVIRRILKKEPGTAHEEERRALEDGLRRAKRETERSLLAHFKDFQENVKFQYMLRLADAAGERLYESLTGHFRGYQSNLKELIKTIGREHTDKGQLESNLSTIEASIDELQAQIGLIRSKIDVLRADLPTTG